MGLLYFYLMIYTCLYCVLEIWEPQPPGTLRARPVCNVIAVLLPEDLHVFRLRP